LRLPINCYFCLLLVSNESRARVKHPAG
jgi:hypothetical protein